MKRIIMLCAFVAMCVVSAVAQYIDNVYYQVTINGVSCRFEGKNAPIAAKRLMTAKRLYLLNVQGKENVRVYRLKKKGEYAIMVGNNCFYYHANMTINCSYAQIKHQVKWEVSPDDFSLNGCVFGTSSNGTILAIYEN